MGLRSAEIAADLGSDVTQHPPPSHTIHRGISCGTITTLSPQPIIPPSCVSVWCCLQLWLCFLISRCLSIYHSIKSQPQPPALSIPTFQCALIFFVYPLLPPVKVSSIYFPLLCLLRCTADDLHTVKCDIAARAGGAVWGHRQTVRKRRTVLRVCLGNKSAH